MWDCIAANTATRGTTLEIGSARVHTLAVGAALIGIAIVALTACGGSSEDNVTTVTQTVQATTTAAAATEVTWDYLKSEYAEFLGNKCEGYEDYSPTYNSCIGMQEVQMEKFTIDAEELPPSEERSSLLQWIQDYQDKSDEYDEHMCAVYKPAQGNTDQYQCLMAPYHLSQTYDMVVLIVNRNAGE